MKLLKSAQLYRYLCFLFLIGYRVVEGSGSGILVQARSLAEIQETKEIRICVVAPNGQAFLVEPVDCHENCKFGGYVYEMVMAFVETLDKDIKPKLLRVEWDEQFFNKAGKIVWEDSYTPELLASGRCDFYPGLLTKTPQRLKKLDFVTLFPSRTMVVVHKSKKARFNTVTDLCGKVAETTKDTSEHAWLQEQNQTVCTNNPIQIEFINIEDTGSGVDESVTDFWLTDADAAIWETHHRFKNSIGTFTVGPVKEIGWGFRKEDKDLQAAVQKFFDTQKAIKDSTLNTIWKKYLGITLIDFIGLITYVN